MMSESTALLQGKRDRAMACTSNRVIPDVKQQMPHTSTIASLELLTVIYLAGQSVAALCEKFLEPHILGLSALVFW